MQTYEIIARIGEFSVFFDRIGHGVAVFRKNNEIRGAISSDEKNQSYQRIYP